MIFALLLWLATAPVQAAEMPEARTSVVGHWQFSGKIYNGTEMPEDPDARLRMFFTFYANGESRLAWYHTDENFHCQRKGRYQVVGDQIQEEVTWVDPKNSYGCGDDPDMQLGKKSKTPFYFRGADFVLRFFLNEDPLDLIWKRIPEGEENETDFARPVPHP